MLTTLIGSTASSTGPARKRLRLNGKQRCPDALLLSTSHSTRQSPISSSNVGPVGHTGAPSLDGQNAVSSRNATEYVLNNVAAGNGSITAFLRLSPDCKPSGTNASPPPLVYLDRPVTVFGRAPCCNVQMESCKVPLMISRVHAHVERSDKLETQVLGSRWPPAEWQIVDVGSTNGVIVNGELLPKYKSQLLHNGDVITFGRKVIPPEFEFIFEKTVNFQGLQTSRSNEPPRDMVEMSPVAASRTGQTSPASTYGVTPSQSPRTFGRALAVSSSPPRPVVGQHEEEDALEPSPPVVAAPLPLIVPVIRGRRKKVT